MSYISQDDIAYHQVRPNQPLNNQKPPVGKVGSEDRVASQTDWCERGVLSSSLGPIRYHQSVSLFQEAAGHSMVHKKEVHP